MNQQNNDYLARLGLETDPFPAAEDSSMYYENPDLMQRLDMIQHLIGFSNQMIFITGEKGVGKSSMLDRLEYYAPDHWRICRIQANPMLNTPILLRQLTSGFELDVSADADDLFQVYSEALQNHIETLERAMLMPVVLIDDAHELPVDAFTMLFGFMQQEGGHSRLKMALFCEPQITTMLDSQQLKTLSHNLTHQLEIPPFDEQQTREYLEQRLSHAGLVGDFPFLDATVQKIHQQSGGVAGKIHTLAQQALLDEGSQSNQSTFGGGSSNDEQDDLPVVDEILDFEEDVEETFPAMSTLHPKQEKEAPVGRKFHSWQIGAVAAVLGLLAVVLWLTSQFSDDIQPAIAEEIPLDITPEPVEAVVQEAVVQDPGLFEESERSIQSATIVDQAVFADPAAVESASIDPLDDFVQTLEENQQELDRVTDTAHQQREVTVQIDENGNAQFIEASQTETPQTELPIATTEPIIEPEPEPLVIAAVEPPVVDVVETPVVATEVEPEPVTPPVVKPEANQKPSINDIKGESWLRTQKDSHILLQLLGTHDQVALKKIIKGMPMGNNIAWFTTVHNGEPWYVVVKGPYKDRAVAADAISAMPADLKKRKPWPRTVADVKKAMDKAL